MNKLFVAMFVAGSFAMLLGSCKKNETNKDLVVGLPTFEEEADGRAYIDITSGNSFKWNANDEIVIFNLDNQEEQAPQKAIYEADANAQGKGSATFTFKEGDEIGDKMYGYFVFYPSAKVDDIELDATNHQSFNVPATQEYTLSPSNNPTIAPEGMAMACTLGSIDGSFSLKHVFGALRLKLKGTGNVTKIVVEDERFNLNGSATMKLHAVDMNRFSTLQNYFINTDDPDNNPTFVNAWNSFKTDLDYSAEGGDKTMTLNCPGVALNTSTETHFFIGLRPGALKYGFKVNVYLEGQEEPVVLDYTGANNLHYGIKAGVIKGLVATL